MKPNITKNSLLELNGYSQTINNLNFLLNHTLSLLIYLHYYINRMLCVRL
jgi:hypothetical protein